MAEVVPVPAVPERTAAVSPEDLCIWERDPCRAVTVAEGDVGAVPRFQGPVPEPEPEVPTDLTWLGARRVPGGTALFLLCREPKPA